MYPAAEPRLGRDPPPSPGPSRAALSPCFVARSKLPNTLLDPERGVSLCLFVKDPASELEEVLASAPVPGFDRVIGYKKLREEFREFKRRRALLAEHDGFFCDDRILPMLPKLVGKTFLRPRQTPVPVRISRVPVGDKAAASKGGAGRALAAALAPARDSTWIRLMGQGSTFSVRTGFPYFTPDQLADNAAAVVARAAETVPGGWRNVQAVFIKSTNSVPLQVYASLASLGNGDTATEVSAAALKAVGPRKRARSPAGKAAAADEEAASPKRVAKAKAAAPKGKDAVRAVRAVLGDDVTTKQARGGRRKSRRK